MNANRITARAIIPSFSYVDAPRAIEFLCDVFGFEKQVVYESTPGIVDHAQLKLGDSYIMLGTARDDETWPSKTPAQLGGTTSGVYVALENDAAVDAHYERARAAGADIFRPLESPEYGGRNYGVRDCEGYLWGFGSYFPEES